MADIHDFKDLRIWQEAMKLAREVYRASGQIAKAELFGLVSQMRRASVSVPANIAEGYGRGSLLDYVRFLRTARGSLCELETEIILAKDLSLLPEQLVVLLQKRLNTCARLLQGLIRSLEARKTERNAPA